MKLSQAVYIFSVLFLLAGLPSGWARQSSNELEGISASEKTPQAAPSHFEDYVNHCSKKFDFGTHNFLMGWTEIISTPMDHYDQAKDKSKGKRVAGALAGFGEGVILGSVNTVGGFLNSATALVPPRIPLPKNGINLDQVLGGGKPAVSNP